MSRVHIPTTACAMAPAATPAGDNDGKKSNNLQAILKVITPVFLPIARLVVAVRVRYHHLHSKQGTL